MGGRGGPYSHPHSYVYVNTLGNTMPNNVAMLNTNVRNSPHYYHPPSHGHPNSRNNPYSGGNNISRKMRNNHYYNQKGQMHFKDRDGGIRTPREGNDSMSKNGLGGHENEETNKANKGNSDVEEITQQFGETRLDQVQKMNSTEGMNENEGKTTTSKFSSNNNGKSNQEISSGNYIPSAAMDFVFR